MRILPNPKLTIDMLPDKINKETGGRFDLFIEALDKGLDYANIGRLLGKNRMTIKRWAKLYNDNNAKS